MASKRVPTSVKVLLVLAAVAGILGGSWLLTRPVAQVAIIDGGTAFNAVPGSVVVKADRDEQLRADVSGRILTSSLIEGAPFKKGDVLAQVDTADLLLDIERTETDLNSTRQRVEIDRSAELALETAKSEFENFVRLHKQGALADFEMEKREREYKLVQQKVELTRIENQRLIDSLDNQLRTKQRQLEKMTIRAPFDGVVSRVLVKENALVSNGESIASIVSIQRTVEAKVSEENFAGVRPGQKAVVRFLGYDGTFDAVVTKLLPTADPETQRYIVHLDVTIDPQRLVPGITGEVNIIVGERQAQALVPRRALFGHSLWVVKNGIVEARPVQLGFVSLNIVEVVGNLAPGEAVIIDDIDQFHAGQRVRTEVRQTKK